jgi:hypothetical protein
MSTIKSIYNSTALESVLELLWITLGVRFDPDFVTYELVNVDGNKGKLIITARANAADGRLGIYSGTTEFVYDKLDINSILPTDIVYGDTYPMTFEKFRSYLENSYDYLLEEDEFYQVADVTQRPLGVGDKLGMVPDVNEDVYLRTTALSKRWKAGATVRLHLTRTAENSLPPLVITNSAPDSTVGDAYDFAYVGSGGQAPYTWEVVEGTPVGPWDAEAQRLTGIPTSPGIKTWTIRMTDARGYYVDFIDTAEAIVAPLVFTNAAPVGQAGTPFTHQYTLHGGVAPFSFVKAGVWPRGLELSSTGLLSGALDSGTYNVRVKVIDAQGTEIDLLEMLNIGNRPNAAVAQSLVNKLVSWYAMDDGQNYMEGTVLRDLHGGFNLTINTDAASILGQRIGALRLRGQMAAGGGVAHDFTDNFAVVTNLRGAPVQQGRYLINRLSPTGGWGVRTDVVSGDRLAVEAFINDQPVEATSSDSFFDNAWHHSVIQRAGGFVDFFRDNVTAGSSAIALGTLDVQPEYTTTVGRRANGQDATDLHVDLDGLALFDDRLWSDERAYLFNGGNMISYNQLMVDAGQVPAQAALTITGSPNNAVLNQAYLFDLTISGGNGVYLRPRLIEGTLPAGITATITGNKLRLGGTPTASGQFSATLAVDSGDYQTAMIGCEFEVAALASLTLPNYRDVVMGHNPIRYYRLADTGTVALDETGNFNGTLSGAISKGVASINGDASPCMVFAGGRIDIGTVFGTGDFTNYSLEAWVRADQLPVDSGVILGQGSGDPAIGSNTSLNMDQFGNYRGDKFPPTAGWVQGDARKPGDLVHVVYVETAAGRWLYYDKQQAGFAPGRETYTGPATGNMSIGSYFDGTMPFFGALKDVALYDYPLDIEQITAHYDAGQKWSRWSNYDYAAGILLAENARRATTSLDGPSGARGLVRSEFPITTQTYFEFDVVAAAGTGDTVFFGICDGRSTLTAKIDANTSGLCIALPSRKVFANGVELGVLDGTGQRFGVAVDPVTRSVWVRSTDGTWLGGGDPATDTAPTYVLGGAASLLAAAEPFKTGSSVALISWPTGLQGAAPTGFEAGLRERAVTVSMLHFNEAAGATAWSDTKNVFWTKTGAPVQVTDAMFLDSVAMSGNANADYLSSGPNQIDLQRGPFAIEFSIKVPAQADSGYAVPIMQYGEGIEGADGFALSVIHFNNGQHQLAVRNHYSNLQGVSFAARYNAKQTILIQRGHDGNLRVCLNGTTWSPPLTIYTDDPAQFEPASLSIGRSIGSWLQSKGYLVSELRIITGSQVYRPGAPYTPNAGRFKQ